MTKIDLSAIAAEALARRPELVQRIPASRSCHITERMWTTLTQTTKDKRPKTLAELEKLRQCVDPYSRNFLNNEFPVIKEENSRGSNP